MSIRQRQVESVLQRTISEVLQRRVADPRIEGMISITKIEVSPNLHDATVFVSVLPDRYSSRTLHGLRHAAGRIYRLVRSAMNMRTVPNLHFELDGSLKKQAAVFEAIRKGLGRDDLGREDSLQ